MSSLLFTLPLMLAGQPPEADTYDFDREFVERSLHFWEDDDWSDATFNTPGEKQLADETFRKTTPGSSANFRAADAATMPGQLSTDDFVRQLLNQRGQEYEWGGTSRSTGFDCSGLIYSTLIRNGFNPPRTSGELIAHARPMTVAKALKTRGALLWREGHVAISLGNGKTIEAKGEDYGVGTFDAAGRFTKAGVLPELSKVLNRNGKESHQPVRDTSRAPGKRYRRDPNEVEMDDFNPMSTIPGVMMTLYGDHRSVPQQRDARPVRGRVPEFVPEQYRNLFLRASRKYGIPVRLLALQAQKESGFDPDAQSPAGALGMMQIMPQYHKLNDYFDAHESVMYGAKYLSDLIAKYNGNVRDALAYYNAGSNLAAGYGYADELIDAWRNN